MARIYQRLREVAEWRTAFRNWFLMLMVMVLQKIVGAPSTLVARTRGGSTVVCPNLPVARGAIFQVFCGDEYRLDATLARLGNCQRVIDIGAHVGSFTLAVKEHMPSVKVTCIEPDRTSFVYLTRNLTWNGLDGDVVVLNVAIGDTDGETEFFERGSAFTVNGTIAIGGRPSRSIVVPTLTLSSVMARTVPQESLVDLIKMDCEGAEFLVFDSTPAEVWSRVRALVLEYHPVHDRSWHSVCDKLSSVGFHSVWHLPSADIHDLGTALFEREL